jgi:hypothetical protein
MPLEVPGHQLPTGWAFLRSLRRSAAAEVIALLLCFVTGFVPDRVGGPGGCGEVVLG